MPTGFFELLTLWVMLTWGLSYLISRADITEPIRVWFISILPLRITPLVAFLLSCRACTGTWTGATAAAILMAFSALLEHPTAWHAWLWLPPLAGVCSVGFIDLLSFVCRNRGKDAT